MHDMFRNSEHLNKEHKDRIQKLLKLSDEDMEKLNTPTVELGDGDKGITIESNERLVRKKTAEDFVNKPVNLDKAVKYGKLPTPYEPKKENRFLVTLPKYFDIDSWVVSDIDCPRYRVGMGWAPINIRFVDPIGPSTSQRLHKLVEDIEKNGVKPFNYTHESLDPTGVVIQKWEIKGCHIEEIDFGYDSYSSDNIKYIHMRVKPITCHLVY